MKRLIAISLLLSTAALQSGYAETLTADAIIEKANQASYYAGDDGIADVKMVIEDAKGGTREREFRILRLNDGADQKFYVYFKEPADVRKMAYLVWKHAAADQEDDRWLWLPALNLSRRIAPGDKRSSFVGSDFVYEDVSGRSPDADTHELIKEADGLYEIKNTPRDADSVEFAHYTVWINNKSFLPVKAEYVDKQGKTYRRVEALKTKVIDGITTVTESKVSDLVAGSSTLNTFSNVKYNVGLKDQIFSERFLRRPPREATQ
jgi:hypothetical protein